MNKLETKYLSAIDKIEEIEQLQKLAIQAYEEGMIELMYNKFNSNASSFSSISVRPAEIVIRNNEICENKVGFLLESKMDSESSDADDNDDNDEKSSNQQDPMMGNKFRQCLQHYVKLAKLMRTIQGK